MARIRAASKAPGVQLTHVPDLAGVSRSHFWDVLAGRKSPTVTWLTKIAVALRCEPAELLSAMGTKFPAPAPSAGRNSAKVPLVSVRAAAGAFTEPEAVEASGFITARTRRVIKPGMFAAAVSGRSMEPLIRDGSICLFRPMKGKDPENRVVLIQLRDATDPESGGRYTVKRFKVAGRRDGRISRVRLDPANREFKPILLEEDPMRQLTVIAEYLEVLVPGPR
ncbi:MAG TPA: LexA family transcriptional regulator [Myxococcales bacterium]|nr:LexA family transcriptional regulator [Myxococcales bacterium]